MNVATHATAIQHFTTFPTAGNDGASIRAHTSLILGMDRERTFWFPHWREIAENYLPRKYPWLMSQKEIRTPNRRNNKLLDSVSTIAVRTLASGMMNGITSPARPWFRLRIPGFDEATMTHASKVWLEEVTRRMLVVLAESNFYKAIAQLYLEWCTFGTAAMIIYEDFDDVIRFYNLALGEFFLAQNATQRVDVLARRFTRTVRQLVQEFGIDNVSDNVRNAFNAGGARVTEDIDVHHVIEPNDPDDGLLKSNAPFREVYWEPAGHNDRYLRVAAFDEWPCVTPRWEVQGNDTYGTSPAMDALADVKELQTLLKQKGIGLARQMSPPLLVDQQLRNRPKALGANGITYAATSNSNFGAKPVYEIKTPLQEISNDVLDLRSRIRETCHNDLFNMISNLDTVRSATEIEARRGEQLVHLGPVLERLENEGLDPTLKRTFATMQRKGLLPEPPEELADVTIDVEYVSVLSDAQRSVGSASVERYMAFTAEMAGVWPEVLEVPDVDELMRSYAESIGVKASGVKSREQVASDQAKRKEQEALQATAELGKTVSEGAKNLSDTDVGGGQNALQGLFG